LRLLVAAIAACLMLSAFAAPVNAGRTPFDLVVNLHDAARVIEQQSDFTACSHPDPENPYPGDEFCVLNPSPPPRCLWDVDDRIVWGSGGFIEPGQVETASHCIFADWAHHMWGAEVYSDSPDLTVSAHFDPQNETWTTGPPVWVPARKLWLYRGCVVGPVYAGGQPTLRPIAGSNGGYAVPTTLTVSVSRPSGGSGKPVAIGATLTYRNSEGTNQARYCASALTEVPRGGELWWTGL
jgi:hypothetical protein